MRATAILIVVGALGTIPKDLIKGLECWNSKMSSDCVKDNILKFGQNTEKSPGNLKIVSITQTVVKYHQ